MGDGPDLRQYYPGGAVKQVYDLIETLIAGGGSGLGATGPTGPNGNDGAAGAPGATGSTGSTGAAGAQGTAGTAGAAGSAGAVGATGPQGAAGGAGAAGSTGPTGAAGAGGSVGGAGPTGPAGTAGTAGTNGTNGAAGATGPTGPTGANGTGGVTGPAGAGSMTLNSQIVAYTLVLGDANNGVLHPSADTTARTFTIPANTVVAFPVGTCVTFINQNAAGVLTLAITTDTMRLAGPGTTGSRTLAANGLATAVKVTATEWLISGVGLT